ncbi:hypothetical protein L596_010855 [Steinernema carpocapsae]|uniref:tyrosine--tRNA ligase n=1 Tax=Steinernema carpocapsae TaxID=34508 RepID=A0A4V6A716_STECR|nr:hypothetical protein L596_010855 [Steinernema carpocapsae]
MLQVTMAHLGGFESVKIQKTSEFEFSREYTLDMYKMASKITRGASDLVKGNFLATHLIPIYFALDHHYAGLDLAIMGEDMEADYVNEAESQLGFPVQATKLCEAIGYKGFASLLVPTILGMNGAKMGSQDAENLLEPFDTPKQVETKIKKSFCEPGNLKGNIALHLAKELLFPHFLGEKGLEIEGDPKHNEEAMQLVTYEDLEQAYASEKIFPTKLKAAVSKAVDAILAPVRTELAEQQKKLLADAFPVQKGGRKKK